jgi:hypothetical protein
MSGLVLLELTIGDMELAPTPLALSRLKDYRPVLTEFLQGDQTGVAVHVINNYFITMNQIGIRLIW